MICWFVMMFMINLINTLMKRDLPLLPFIKKCRKLTGICVTPLRYLSKQEQESTPAEKITSKLEKERQKVELYFRKRRSDFTGHYSFVIDDRVAAAIAEEVVKSIDGKDNVSVVEINPGMGKITQCLLQTGIKKIVLCEVKQCFWSMELLKKHEKNITLYHYKNLLSKSMYNIDLVIPSNFLQQEGEPSRIIVINSSRMLIRNMLQSIAIIDYNILAKSELYLLLNEQIFRGFQDSSEITSEVVDYAFIDVVFDMEVLAEFPREVVLPPTSQKWNKMYFVRLKRKKKPLVSPENIKMYWNFVNIFTKKKSLRVIPSLEKWIPGCGPLLIADGLLVSTKLRELTKSDWLRIFESLVSHSDFKYQMEMLKNEDFSLTEIV